MSEGQWSALDVLTTLPGFTHLAKDMEKNSDDWCVHSCVLSLVLFSELTGCVGHLVLCVLATLPGFTHLKDNFRADWLCGSSSIVCVGHAARLDAREGHGETQRRLVR
jgi:hypothetical protein